MPHRHPRAHPLVQASCRLPQGSPPRLWFTCILAPRYLWYAQRLELVRVAHERLAGIPIIHDAEYAFPDGLWLNSWVILKKAE